MIQGRFHRARLSVALLSAAGVSHAATLHVPADFHTIQAAVDAAQAGDQILVAAGLYRENLEISKAVELVSESGASTTTIDGRQRGAVLTIGRTDFAQSVRVSGFTLRHGYGGNGGGVAQLGGSMIIEDNQVINNRSVGIVNGGAGGGVYVHGGAIIRHNLIAHNLADGSGGGICVAVGGNPTPLVLDNVIQKNTAGDWPSGGHGGGLYVATKAVIQRNVIRENTAYGFYDDFTQEGGEAGGLMVWTEYDPVEVADNAILNNDSVFDGGGVVAIGEYSYSPRIRFVNNTIVGNTSGSFSQLSTGRYGSRLTFANNVIASTDGSTAISCNGYLDAGSPVFVNNDVYDGSTTPASGTCASTAISGTNLTAGPKFAAHAEIASCQLAAGSPLIDAGSNAFARKQPEDLVGNPRVADGGRGSIIDIGACEYPAQ